MVIRLIFSNDAVPRTTKREEWRKIYRWKRETEKKMKEELDRQIKNLILFGCSHPEILERCTDRIVNPPVMFWTPPK